MSLATRQEAGIALLYRRAQEEGDWRAMEALFARAYGKPKETVEQQTTVRVDTVEQVRALTSEQRRALLARARELPAGDVVEVDAVEVD